MVDNNIAAKMVNEENNYATTPFDCIAFEVRFEVSR
jgi:hypothetical protein